MNGGKTRRDEDSFWEKNDLQKKWGFEIEEKRLAYIGKREGEEGKGPEKKQIEERELSEVRRVSKVRGIKDGR